MPGNTAYAEDYRNTDFRAHPYKYKIGKGEQGVLMAEPYKSEILPYWRFATSAAARESAQKIYDLFLEYKNNMILSAWTWPASFYRWDLRVHAGMLIMHLAENMMKPGR